MARLSPRAATAALDQAHWKLNPPRRPSTSSISPDQVQSRTAPRLHRRRVDLLQVDAARRGFGEVVAARIDDGNGPRRQGVADTAPRRRACSEASVVAAPMPSAASAPSATAAGISVDRIVTGIARGRVRA